MRRVSLALAVAAVLAVAAFRACRDAPLRPVAAPRRPPPDPHPPPPTGEVEPPNPPPPAVTKETVRFVTPTPAPEPVRPEVAASSVWGVATLMGERPRPKRSPMAADPQCAALHADPPLSDELVVGHKKQVRWALIHVSRGLGSRRFQAPAVSAGIDQVGCLYIPHVLGVMAGQPVEFRNADPLLHNVHGLPFGNKEFNFGQHQGAADRRVFGTPEIFKVKCDVHPWMSAWIGVFDHPFFAVTDEEGVYRLPELPPGRYAITAWHEALKAETREVDAGAVDTRLDFLLQRR